MTPFHLIWLIALIFKLAIGTWLPFASDEAYYWVWGQNPQLSYYDHPAGIGWLFWLGSKIDFAGQSSRIPGLVLGHATWLIWHSILKPFMTSRQLSMWLLLVLLSPLIGLGGLIMTPDLPLLFFWSLSLLALLRSVESGSPYWYAFLGLSLGLGFCSKYHIVLFVPAALLWLLFGRRHQDVRWRWVPLTVVMGLLACMPVLWWNLQNDFVSFAFQLKHGFAGQEPNWKWPLEYLSSQVFLIFPPILWLALRKNQGRLEQCLSWMAWFPLAFFLYSSFKARAEANWTMVAYPSLIALAVLKARSDRWLKITLATWAVACAIAVTHALAPWIPVDPRRFKTYEFVKFDALIEPAQRMQPFYAGSYQMASSLGYKLRSRIYKLGGLNRRDFYDFQTQSYPDSAKFYVALERYQTLPAWVLEKGYAGEEVINLNGGEFRVLEVKKFAQDTDR